MRMWFCSSCSHPELKPCVSSDYLNCVCMNARSIVSKKLDLLAYITAHAYDIIAVTETFLDNTIIANFEFAPPSYVVFHHDHDRHGGDVLILVCNSIPLFCQSDLATDCEIVWLQINSGCPSHLLFGVYYHPPGWAFFGIFESSE